MRRTAPAKKSQSGRIPPARAMTVLDQIKSRLPIECSRLLEQRDGASRVVEVLRDSIDPTETAQGQCGIWDDCARYYAVQGRFYEALSIYYAMLQS